VPGDAHCHGDETFEIFQQVVYPVSRGPFDLPGKVRKKKRPLLPVLICGYAMIIVPEKRKKRRKQSSSSSSSDVNDNSSSSSETDSSGKSGVLLKARHPAN